MSDILDLPVEPNINAQTSVTAASTDEVLIADASDSWILKKTTAQSIADLGGGGGGGGFQNPADDTWKVFHEEFNDNGQIYLYGPMNLFGAKSGTGATIARHDHGGPTDAGRIGMYRHVAGTAAAAYTYHATSMRGNRFYTGGAAFRNGSAVKFSIAPDATNDSLLFLGVSDVLHIIGTNEIGLFVDRTVSTTNWIARTRLNGTSTETDTGVAFDTSWIALEVLVNEDGTEVTFYINGVLKATHTTNIPLNKNMTSWNMRTQWVAGSTGIQTFIDWAYYAFKPQGTGRDTIHTWIS